MKYVVLIIMMISSMVSQSRAGDFLYADYAKDIAQIAKTIESECKANGVGSSTDANAFRKACGETMRGIKYAGFDDVVFFKRNQSENGLIDVLGIERQITGDDGELYSLIRSLNTTSTRPHEQLETATSQADATLFVKRQDGWQPVWRFVNPHANDWLKADPMFPQHQGLTPQVASMIDRMWREVVVKETAKLAFNIKDAIGPVFSARNPKVRK